jgi:hypothetical protein
MELLLTTFTAGWASGVNAYLAAALLGLLGRLGADVVPDALARTDVLVVLSVLAVLEVAAEKVPVLDSVWDVVHTPLRVAAGSLLGALLSSGTLSDADVSAATTAAVGGVSALASHVVKTTLRLSVNSSPEPASNIAMSVLEDFLVALAVVLAVVTPVVAAVLTGVLLVLGLLAALFAATLLRRTWRRLASWRRTRLTPA